MGVFISPHPIRGLAAASVHVKPSQRWLDDMFTDEALLVNEVRREDEGRAGV